MKIVLVAGRKPIIEIKKLAEELTERGASVSFITPELELRSMTGDFWLPFKEADLVYYRSGFGDAFREEMSSVVTESQTVINREVLSNQLLSNKLYQAKQVNKIGIRIPKTIFGERDFGEIIEVLGLPFIFKAANGIQGKEVYLIKDEEQYREVSKLQKGERLSQEYIPNNGDFRVFVLNKSVANLYKRVPAEGSFKANMYQGGSGKVVTDSELREVLSEISVQVAKQLKLDITGIDIIQSTETGELFFIEANVNPGWKGLDQVLKTNTSATIANWFIDSINKN